MAALQIQARFHQGVMLIALSVEVTHLLRIMAALRIQARLHQQVTPTALSVEVIHLPRLMAALRSQARPCHEVTPTALSAVVIHLLRPMTKLETLTRHPPPFQAVRQRSQNGPLTARQLQALVRRLRPKIPATASSQEPANLPSQEIPLEKTKPKLKKHRLDSLHPLFRPIRRLAELVPLLAPLHSQSSSHRPSSRFL